MLQALESSAAESLDLMVDVAGFKRNELLVGRALVAFLLSDCTCVRVYTECL